MIGVTRRRQRDPKKQNQTKRMVSHNEVRAVSKGRSFSLRRRNRHFRYKGKLRVFTTSDPLLQIHKDFREKLPPKWGPNGNLGTGGLFLCYAATLLTNKIFLFSVVTSRGTFRGKDWPQWISPTRCSLYGNSSLICAAPSIVSKVF